MDPALWEMLEGDADDEIQVIIQLRYPNRIPPGVRVVTQFKDIATCRLRRGDIRKVWSNEGVISLKAPRLLAAGGEVDLSSLEDTENGSWNDEHRPPLEKATGRGVVVGAVDWGIDFAHPDFCHQDGSTRLLALWDQRHPYRDTPNRYGYGTIHTAADINRALTAADPYEVLGYYPSDSDPKERGSHGTHVMGIAAGNGRAGGPVGVAPEADLIFVHLATRYTGGLANLGDSVALLEAIDFIVQTVDQRPWVINLSVGRHGGPHDGTTMVERALDDLLMLSPGRAIAQSVGNYFQNDTHTSGRLRSGESMTLTWWTDAADVTPNELEIWYSGRDTFSVKLVPPQQTDAVFYAAPGKHSIIEFDEQEVGRIYHRLHDPGNQDNHLDIFLAPEASAGPWQVTLIGEQITDGRFHAWIERDDSCLHCQSKFDQAEANSAATTGTICNGFHTVTVGAYNSHFPDREIASFSSQGPTRDGRHKPDLVAPGVNILSARSAPPEGASYYVRKSGTSMATPHVTGTIALMFEAASQPLSIEATRQLLLSHTQVTATENLERMGKGYLDIEQAVEAARQFTRKGSPEAYETDKPVYQEEVIMNT